MMYTKLNRIYWFIQILNYPPFLWIRKVLFLALFLEIHQDLLCGLASILHTSNA